ncbi:hypothetical protein [Streptomyces genisteinicus]|uniref:hypothetical protein n=1 Tax=Streptomyces genisteinicus TaxID=2768068 RepID=UPI0024835787|nr:hypothetical protein [Streptomyces genisteinicus]
MPTLRQPGTGLRRVATAVAAALLITGAAAGLPSTAAAAPGAQDRTAASPADTRTTAAAPAAPAGAAVAAAAPELLLGQSTRAAWDDFHSFGQDADGGSVYYELRSGDWVGPGHRDYATLLASRNKTVQIGVSWKDNPPGFPGGDENTKAARSRAVTAEIAAGGHTAQLDRLLAFTDAHPGARFKLRLDYEVSSHYHCTDASCSSYKGAFTRLASYLDSRSQARNLEYVFHPVRGEFEAMYPGDAAVDWMGVSVFAHELCLPIYERGYLYNGTPPQNYDVAASQCRNAYIGTDSHGNPAAVWRNFDHDGNVLKLVKFAKDHGKPVVLSEAGMMNFTADAGATHGMEQERGDLWVRRLFSLLNYQGPIPNLPGTHDLRGVIRSVVYIDLDFRYGWDGIDDGSFDFAPDTTWFVDGRLSRYGAAKASFCQGLAANGFTARCR